MATIKNVEIIAKTRDNARVIAKEIGGKVIDNGAKSSQRWTVKADRKLTLKRSSINLFKGVKTLGKTNVYTKQAFKMHLSLTGNLI